WHDYWLNLPENPTESLYAQITVSILTSFYARAFSQHQIFEKFEEFTAAAKAGELKAHKDDWLPKSLVEAALKQAPKIGDWTIQKVPGKRELVCTLKDGNVIRGTFVISNSRVKS